MPTPQEDQLNANIDLLFSVHFENMDGPTRQNLMSSMDDIRTEYVNAAAQAKTSKYHKDVSEAIAKSVPALVKGAYSAAQAFEKGDYISGSAALMDICASVIPLFTCIASAAGPAGILVGALFSVVGQILSFFTPKQPSMESKIQKMLDHLQNETQIGTITAFGHSVSSYTSSLRTKSVGIHKIEKPQALAGTVSLTQDSKNVSGNGTTFVTTAEVGQWLTFDADSSGTIYKINEIASDTNLTLATPYNGAPAAASKLKQLRRTTVRRSIDEILSMPLKTENQADDFMVAMKELKWGLEKNQPSLTRPSSGIGK